MNVACFMENNWFQHSQLELPSIYNEEDAQIQLELKPYIQPFEQLLAQAELVGLLPDVNIRNPLDEFASSSMTIETTQSIDFLIKRLAYWQRVGKGRLLPTLQVLYEASENLSTSNGISLLDAVRDQLPKARRLRYGPHDLHEYRGKFFPQLVKALINFSGVPEGSVVIDPTCGSGTTNCEARLMGMETIGLDLNPLSVLIARTKVGILEVSPLILQTETEKLLQRLEMQSTADVSALWNLSDLQYLERWFDSQALVDIAYILEPINLCQHPILRDFYKVSLSNIIRGISWQKETDLRVRKEVTEYLPGAALERFKEELQRQLSKLVPFLLLAQQAQTPSEMPKFKILEGDTKDIDQIFEEKVGLCDVLITSPPYATALPYIDTDRLSLIVLGLLPRGAHRNREFTMIGNREVMESQRQELWDLYQEKRSELPDIVCAFVDDLAGDYHNGNVGFRRRNLPALLAKYFLDMTSAMMRARNMMKPESYAFYVVGNNSTRVNEKRIEIPTDRFLWEIGKKVGWFQEKIIDMELLPSRDIFKKNRGTAEKILVFTSTLKRKAVYSNFDPQNHQSEDNGWDFHDENTQEHLHVLHPYPARFIPQVPRKAILEYSKAGDLVLDPFCGCGTTLLESVLLERSAIGVDNNAVAILVTKAKLAHYTDENLNYLREFVSNIDDLVTQSPNDAWRPDYKNLNYWFDERAITELSKLRWVVDTLTEPCKTLALAVFSSIIVRVSYQDSDTRYAKIERPYTPGEAIRAYKNRFVDAIRQLAKIVGELQNEAIIHLDDSRELGFLQENAIDLIVTSPPYLNAYDYHKYHRQRLHWIEGDIELARNLEIGKHDTFTRPKATPDRYFEDMEMCFKEWRRVLRPGGRALIVIGDSIVSGQPVPVADHFTEIMARLGLSLEKHWLRRLLKESKSFNRSSRIDQEHVLLYTKG